MKNDRNYSRRKFFRYNSIIGAEVFLGVGSLRSGYTKLFGGGLDTGKKIYVTPSYFSGSDDLPPNIFGDLCLIRKGSRAMTMGSGATSIEPIESIDEWAVKADALRKIHNMILGSLPSKINCSLSIRTDSETIHDNIIERRVSYLLSPGERVSSIMLIPKGLVNPSPALLTIHPTTGKGKEQAVGRGEKVNGQLTTKAYNRAYGLHLAERGYITFSPDLLGAGERIFPGRRPFDNQPFIDANPEWSGTGKDLWDLRRAIDVMESFSEVDSSRIGSIGHSQGAGLTGILSAMDERIKVGVANCGIWPLRISKNPFNKARTGWFTGIPALRPYLYLGKPVPVDSHEILALSAPRPFLIITALNDVGYNKEDERFTRSAWENLNYNVKKIYALHDEEQKFNCILHMNGHDFPEEMRNIAYKFIERYL